MDLGTCEHCHNQDAVFIEHGPMIWYRDKDGTRHGLYRPEKAICLSCAVLPTEIRWPITDENDCRQPEYAN